MTKPVGYWKRENERYKSYIFICSVCGKKAYFVTGAAGKRTSSIRKCHYKYCPYCGIRMINIDEDRINALLADEED